MMYIVDRIEEGFAVCEDEQKQMHSVLLAQLPAGIKEGDVLIQQDGSFHLDEAATQQRAQRIRAKMRRLWK